MECPEAALAQVPTSAEGPQEDLQVICRGSQNRQVERLGRRGLQVRSPEPGVQGDGDKGSRRGTSDSSQSSASCSPALPDSQKESQLKKGLSSADRRLSLELSTALLPPLGDHLPENNANAEKGRDKEESPVSRIQAPGASHTPEVCRRSHSKSQ